MHWSEDEVVWIRVIVELFTKIFGQDYLEYAYSKGHGTVLQEGSDPRKQFIYDHDAWEACYQTTSAVQSVKTPWLKRVNDDKHVDSSNTGLSDDLADVVPLKDEQQQSAHNCCAFQQDVDSICCYAEICPGLTLIRCTRISISVTKCPLALLANFNITCVQTIYVTKCPPNAAL